MVSSSGEREKSGENTPQTFGALLASRVLPVSRLSVYFPRSLTETTRSLQVTSCIIVLYLFQKSTPFLCIGSHLLIGNELSFWGKKNIDPTIETLLKFTAAKVLVLPACREIIGNMQSLNLLESLS